LLVEKHKSAIVAARTPAPSEHGHLPCKAGTIQTHLSALTHTNCGYHQRSKRSVVHPLLLPLTSLLSGVGMLVVGTGLLFAVIGLQTLAADFPVLVTGLINSAYFAGFVVGTYTCPEVIRRVGHIRAFAAMASIASTLPILLALWLNPWFWGLLRFVNGVCLVGLYIVVESWLNVLAVSEIRGKVFAAYMAVSGIAMALGQWLILVGDSYGFVPFAVVSILFSFALLPITLTPVSQPEPMQAPRLGLAALFATSPIGVVGAVVSGLLSGAFYSLGHVFGQRVGLHELGIALFMAATILGGAGFQWPVGYVSDRMDRRWVLLWVCLSATLVAILGFALGLNTAGSLAVLGVVYGGLTFTIYGLSVAHVNDLVERDRVLEITGGLLLLHGLGATLGPTLAGALMDALGPGSLLLYFASVLSIMALTAWYFIRQRPLNRGEPGHKEQYVVMVDGPPALVQLDPRTPDEPGQEAMAG
jgi:MFS family permease